MKFTWGFLKHLSHNRIIFKLNSQILTAGHQIKDMKYTSASSEQQIICIKSKSQEII